MPENTLSQLSQIATNAQDAAARSAARIHTLLECRKTRIPGADEIAAIIREETAADVAELVAALWAMTPDYSHLAFPEDDADVAAVRRKVIDNARAVLDKHR